MVNCEHRLRKSKLSKRDTGQTIQRQNFCVYIENYEVIGNDNNVEILVGIAFESLVERERESGSMKSVGFVDTTARNSANNAIVPRESSKEEEERKRQRRRGRI